MNAQLVAGYGSRGDDHGVAALDVHPGVVAVGNSNERRQRLSLRARAEDQHLSGLVLVELGRADEDVLGHVYVTQVAGDVQVLAHRAADDADLATDLDRDIGRLLHPVHVGRERGDENASGALRDDLAESLAHQPLRAGDAGPLRVGRVAEQQVDAAVSQFGEPPDVGAKAVDRRVVELPVSRVQHPAGVGLEQDRDRVRD